MIPLMHSVVALALLIAVVAAPARADDRQIRLGASYYQELCSECHGKEGHGDGKTGKALSKKPADLTAISERRGGTFPEKELRAIIDGRTEVADHGQRDMPAWGDVLRPSSAKADAASQEASVKSRIDLLIAYLRSIQKNTKP